MTGDRDDLEKMALDAAPAEWHWDVLDNVKELSDDTLHDMAYGHFDWDSLGED